MNKRMWLAAIGVWAMGCSGQGIKLGGEVDDSSPNGQGKPAVDVPADKPGTTQTPATKPGASDAPATKPGANDAPSDKPGEAIPPSPPSYQECHTKAIDLPGACVADSDLKLKASASCEADQAQLTKISYDQSCPGGSSTAKFECCAKLPAPDDCKLHPEVCQPVPEPSGCRDVAVALDAACLADDVLKGQVSAACAGDVLLNATVETCASGGSRASKITCCKQVPSDPGTIDPSPPETKPLPPTGPDPGAIECKAQTYTVKEKCAAPDALFDAAKKLCGDLQIGAYKTGDCAQSDTSSIVFECCTGPNVPKPPVPTPEPSCTSGFAGDASGATCTSDVVLKSRVSTLCANQKLVLSALQFDDACQAGVSHGAKYSCCVNP